MTEEFNDVFKHYFRARVDPEHLQVGLTVGSEAPVKLSLALPLGANLKRALVGNPEGAILAIDMSIETAQHLYSQLGARFREMDWPLPESATKLAEFQKHVAQDPRRSLRDKKDW